MGRGLFKDRLYQMAAYEPPLDGRSAQDHLLLDFNERTVPVSDSVVEALCSYIRSGELQKYPSYGDILQRLAGYVSVSPDQVMITNGSDQGIDLTIRAAVGEGEQAIIPNPSFAIYEQCARVEGAVLVASEYDPDIGYPTAEVKSHICDATRLIVIPLPNNPSGTGVPREEIEEILQSAPGAVVLVDECYYEYTGVTVVDLIDRYANLVVVRTFSKTWGLPSLRFGFLISQADNIDQLLKIRGPYDVNQLGVIAAQAALNEPDYTQSYVREVMQESKPLLEVWLQERGIRFWHSCANFLWVFPPHADELADFLQSAGILVRPKADSRGTPGLRITLGRLEQTQRLIRELDSFYS